MKGQARDVLLLVTKWRVMLKKKLNKFTYLAKNSNWSQQY